MWRCNVSLEIGDVYVEVSYKGADIPSEAEMMVQVQVIAEEWSLKLVPVTRMAHVAPTSKAGVYRHTCRVMAYPHTVELGEDAA